MTTPIRIPERPYTLEVDQCLQALQVDKEKGLTAQEVDKRLALFGKNTLASKKKKWAGTVFFRQFLSPLIGLLLASGFAIWFLGKPTDAIVVFSVVLLNAIMGTIQEGRAERSLSALRKLSFLRTRIIRDGKEQVADAGDLVPGDIVVLASGDEVPADMRIVESADLEVIESVLTGESYAVSKNSEALVNVDVPSEQSNMVFSSTYIAKGRCTGVVVTTGMHTEVGKIAKLTESSPELKTPIERKVNQFGHHLILAALAILLVFFAIGFFRQMAIEDIFLAAVSQLVSIIPEGLPVAITIALAIGVQRMATQGAIVRRLYAVETLGSTTVICSDKTGTLTKNEMTATQVGICSQSLIELEGGGYNPEGSFIYSGHKISPLDDLTLRLLLEACVLCNDANVTKKNEKWLPIGDPMEASLVVLAKKGGIDPEICRKKHHRLEEIPFNSSHKMMATYYDNVVLVKGALEEVLALCTAAYIEGNLTPFRQALLQQIQYEAHLCASRGKRILGFARFPGNYTAKDGFSSLSGHGEWLGFVAIMDPPRKEVLEAVALCRKAHIRPLMLTGDHVATASAIGKELGIMTENDIAIDGQQLAALSDKEFQIKIPQIAVYARLQPEQKYRVVQALQSQGEVVAMTGDGINDAPALAKADVGVAMGSGTDVAKEAAKIVITDDNFATLVRAIEQGRLVYRNILKTVFYLLATTLAAALVMIVAVTLGYPLPMAAVQVLWSTAYLDEAERCNTVILLNEGALLYEGSPNKLTERVKNRVFKLTNIQGNRRSLLFEVLQQKNVLDGVIQGKDIRIVMAQSGQPKISSKSLTFDIENAAPRFEDAFIDILGGGPGGTSELAENRGIIEEKTGTPVVAHDLTKKFGNFTAVKNVSFTVRRGEIFGLLGPNGAGKSTTFKMLCGLLTPTEGRAEVNGVDLKIAPGKARSNIGYMAQKFSLYGMLNIEQNLDFFSGIYNLTGSSKKKAIQEMVEIFNFQPYLTATAESLPLGYKQRLSLACANMHQPPVLFLDEPTSGVDPITRREFWNHINGVVEKGVTVMVTTHFMDEAEYCDRIALIYRGQVIHMDTPDALKEIAKSEENPNPTLEDAFVKLLEEYDTKNPQ